MSIVLPPLPDEGEFNWYDKRQAWDDVVEGVVEGAETGIFAYVEGTDVSSLPNGAIFGLYKTIDPNPPSGTMPVRVGYQTNNSGGSTESLILTMDPGSRTGGGAIANGDWMIAIVAASPLQTGSFWAAPDEEWETLWTDGTGVGTARIGIFVKQRKSGDTSYTFTYPSARHLNGALMWFRNAAAPSTWVLGGRKWRSNVPYESVTCTAMGIPIASPPVLVMSFGIERTSADETSVIWDGANQWFFQRQEGSANTTIAVGYKEEPAAAVTDDVTITYPNVQEANGLGFAIGIRGA